MLTRQLETQNCPPLQFPYDLASLHHAKIEKLDETFQSPAIKDEATQQLRNLVDQIVVKGTKEEPEYELIGDLADMIALANNKKRHPGRSGASGRT